MKDRNGDGPTLPLNTEVNTIMQLLMSGNPVDVQSLAVQDPEFNRLLALLHRKKIIALENGMAFPLKPDQLKTWNRFKTVRKYNSFIQIMEGIKKKKRPSFWNKKTLKFIGRIVFVVLIGMVIREIIKQFWPGPSPIPQLTVFVTDTKGNVVLEHTGKVNTSLGNRSLRGTIGEDGRVNFDDLQKSYIGDIIQLGFKADGWELVNPDTLYVFTGDPIKLYVQKDASLGIIKGSVRSSDGLNPLPDAAIRINTDTIIYTDKNGFFRTVLPPKFRVEDVHQGYKLEASATGYQAKSEYFYPRSTPADIRLDKIK